MHHHAQIDQQRQLASKDAWEYVCRLYARPGVEAACQDLQNRRNADPVLLLAFCWHAVRGGGSLDPSLIKSLDTDLRLWRSQVIIPLRRLQLGLQDKATTLLSAHRLRRHLLDCEMYAKRMSLQWLAQHLYLVRCTTTNPKNDALTSMLTYWSINYHFHPNEDDHRSLQCLVHYLL